VLYPPTCVLYVPLVCSHGEGGGETSGSAQEAGLNRPPLLLFLRAQTSKGAADNVKTLQRGGAASAASGAGGFRRFSGGVQEVSEGFRMFQKVFRRLQKVFIRFSGGVQEVFREVAPLQDMFES